MSYIRHVQTTSCDISRDMARIWQWFVSSDPTPEAFQRGDHWPGISIDPYLAVRQAIIDGPCPPASYLGVRELLCLATVYGIDPLEQAIGQLLAQGTLGASHLERLLRLREAPKAPPPLQLPNERLRFVPPAPQFQDYDALLLNPDDSEEEKP